MEDSAVFMGTQCRKAGDGHFDILMKDADHYCCSVFITYYICWGDITLKHVLTLHK